MCLRVCRETSAAQMYAESTIARHEAAIDETGHVILYVNESAARTLREHLSFEFTNLEIVDAPPGTSEFDVLVPPGESQMIVLRAVDATLGTAWKRKISYGHAVVIVVVVGGGGEAAADCSVACSSSLEFVFNSAGMNELRAIAAAGKKTVRCLPLGGGASGS